jgi:hypothetical protein
MITIRTYSHCGYGTQAIHATCSVLLHLFKSEPSGGGVADKGGDIKVAAVRTECRCEGTFSTVNEKY